MRYVVVVDMQKDFITGTLGSLDAQSAAKVIVKKLDEYKNDDTALIFTQDTHYANYTDTLEGIKLPIEHCKVDSEGWEIIDDLKDYGEGFFVPYVVPYCTEQGRVFKETFGSLDLINLLYTLSDCGHPVDEIVIMGVCTDICVVSNALLLRAAFPNVPIKVPQDACAGTTFKAHLDALHVMASCQIDIE